MLIMLGLEKETACAVNMRLGTLAFKNLCRRRVRTTLAVLGITIGIALVVSVIMIMDSFQSSMERAFATFGGNLIVQKKGAIDQAFSEVPYDIVDDLEGLPEVEVASPEIWVRRRMGGEPLATLIIGVIPSKSEEATGFSKNIREGNPLTDNDMSKALVGLVVARRMDLNVGSILLLNGENFEVSGIFETASLADLAVIIHLDDAKALSILPEGKVNAVTVRPKSPLQADAIKAHVANSYPDLEVVEPQALMKGAREALNTVRGWWSSFLASRFLWER
ncbi:MAG: macrolide transporter ATP-binding /permease protein [Candidatus Bathyarchaeota archaeon BA1]|nr:MAG: macrolide transporter ATP-binding /permease protein [Candidatus Bathyarchaeota archaeon BA1]